MRRKISSIADNYNSATTGSLDFPSNTSGSQRLKAKKYLLSCVVSVFPPVMMGRVPGALH